jgi:acetyl-CoA acyltransferase
MPLPDSTPVIVAALRTPIGRANADKGYFRNVRSDTLMASLVREIVTRTNIDTNLIEDVILGCSHQSGEQGGNIARIVAILAGLPFTAAGTTVNRWCGSSLEALHIAAHAIRVGDKDIQIVGGLEHMQHLPMETNANFHPSLQNRTSRASLHMGMTAEFLAQSQKIDRAAQDAYALRSHQRAALAIEQGAFKSEILPSEGHDENGTARVFERDQCVRSDTNLEKLAELPPAFVPEFGSVTAGNSSPKNDGAAALLVMSLGRARSLGLQPLVAIRATSVIGVEPALMGTGPIAAVPKVLQRAGLQLADIDVIELNEAFAVQAIACIRGLKLDEERVNVRGGAIAIGHPLGTSGARITTTLLNIMRDRDAKFGLVTMCIGLGQGIATVFERVE